MNKPMAEAPCEPTTVTPDDLIGPDIVVCSQPMCFWDVQGVSGCALSRASTTGGRTDG